MMNGLPDYLTNIQRIEIESNPSRKFFSATWAGDEEVLPLGTDVFVKLLAGESRWFDRLVKRSDFLIRNCKHQHLAVLVGVGRTQSDELPFIVSEYIKGENLRTYMEDFRSPRNAVSLFKKIAAAVSHLHDRSIVHRDLKPENVMISETDNFSRTKDVQDLMVKVCDFDTAKPVNSDDLSSALIGTPYYVTPEQKAGNTAELASDVFVIGLMLYEILAGRRIVNMNELRPSRYNRAVRGNLDQLVLACLQENPAHRVTITQLIDALNDFAHDCVSAKSFPVNPNVPPRDYPRFPIGEFELDVVPIVGGDGQHRYGYPQGIVVESSLEEIQEVPNILLDASEDWLRWREADASRRGAPFENRRQPRVLGIGSGLTEGNDERLYPLRLKIGVTDYYNTQCTNFAINLLMPNGKTIGEMYAGDHNDFQTCNLANPLATNFSIVTCGDDEKYIFMTQRGKMVGGNAEFDSKNRVPAISGTGHPFYDRDQVTNRFCPFEAGRREAIEENLGDYKLQLEEIEYFGFARTGKMMFPFLFGEIRLPEMTYNQFRSQRIIHRHDVYAKEGRPFTIEAVTDWIRELYLRFDENKRNISRPSHTGIFSLYQSLIYEFPDQVNEINGRLVH